MSVLAKRARIFDVRLQLQTREESRSQTTSIGRSVRSWRLRQPLPLLQLPLPLAASGAATVLVDKFDAGRSKARSREDGTTLNQFIVSARGLALGWWQVSERIPSK